MALTIAEECHHSLRDYGSQAIKAYEHNVVTPS